MKLNWVEKMHVNGPLRPISQRKEARYMRELGGGVEGGRVLEIGCGSGRGVEIILNTFGPEYVEAFDFDPRQVDLAAERLSKEFRGRVKLYQGDAAAIPAPDGAFDAVFDFGVLHHIPRNSKSLREIARVLKPGGRFYFMEVLSSFTMHPVMHFLTQHPPEAQFSWEELAAKLAEAKLVLTDGAYRLLRHRVIGVAVKEHSA